MKVKEYRESIPWKPSNKMIEKMKSIIEKRMSEYYSMHLGLKDMRADQTKEKEIDALFEVAIYIAGNEGYTVYPKRDNLGFVMGFGHNFMDYNDFVCKKVYENENSMILEKRKIQNKIFSSLFTEKKEQEHINFEGMYCSLFIYDLLERYDYIVKEQFTEEFLHGIPLKVQIDLLYNMGLSTLKEFKKFNISLENNNRFMAALNLLYTNVDLYDYRMFLMHNETDYFTQTKSRAIRNAEEISKKAVDLVEKATTILNTIYMWNVTDYEKKETSKKEYKKMLESFIGDLSQKGKEL